MKSQPHFPAVSAEQLAEIRQQMFKFAQLQLKDPDLAEDVVQEALTKAYEHSDSFQGASALKTWFFAILKNQIIDLLNYRRRTKNVSEIYDEEDGEDAINTFFDQTGHWDNQNYEPQEWHSVQTQTYQKEFWLIFEACLDHLPALQARVFMMRSYFELDSKDICEECEITTQNLHVLLYRARLQLQSCLSKNWFAGEQKC